MVRKRRRGHGPALFPSSRHLSCLSMPTPSQDDQSAADLAGENGDGAGRGAEELDTASLIEQLNEDRLWLLRQIDGGRWAEWRLDLAALERELGQLIDQARERGVS